jgi:branched-chain amino acid transport system ATP-binding protein
LLITNRLEASYGFLQVLWDLSFQIQEGEFVGLIGPNGAGKTTVLRTIAGLLKPSAGDVVFEGTSLTGKPAYQISRMGISYISEELNLFTAMSVRDNLLLGAYAIPNTSEQMKTLEFVFSLFPRLEERQSQLAGTMSGGERKMLAIARGMMAKPRLMLVDEPSLGLAPHLVTDVFNSLQTLQKMGVTILLVEQRVNATLEIAERAYVLESGRIALQGTSDELKSNPHVQAAYMGI